MGFSMKWIKTTGLQQREKFRHLLKELNSELFMFLMYLFIFSLWELTDKNKSFFKCFMSSMIYSPFALLSVLLLSLQKHQSSDHLSHSQTMLSQKKHYA